MIVECKIFLVLLGSVDNVPQLTILEKKQGDIKKARKLFEKATKVVPAQCENLGCLGSF